MATPTKWGAEFLVNTMTANAQDRPAISKLADGRFVVTWDDMSQTLGDSSGAVHGQIFNADGTTAGTEFLVNTVTQGDQVSPVLTALSDGRFVATFNSGDDNIHAQLFGADGSKIGTEFFINSTPGVDQWPPALATLANDRFVAVWTDYSGGNHDIHARIFNADGTASGGEFVVNTTTVGQQFDTTVTTLSDGRFVAAWQDNSNPDADIRAQIFNADGTKAGAEFVVNPANGHDDRGPSVTALAGGGFAVAWFSDDAGGFNDIIAQVFDSNGNKSGSAILVNTETALDQFVPTVATLADGRFVVAWDDLASGGTGFDVHAQVLNADGTKSGTEFCVNTTTTGFQDSPTVTVLTDGRFVVGWRDDAGDASGSAVHAQIFDPREQAVGLGGTALNDDYVGTKFDDTMKGAGGDDRLTGAGGNDTLVGGAGNDTSVFSQSLDKYTVTDFGDKIVVSGPDGIDTLMGIEHLQFTDGTIDVDDGNALFDTAFYMSHNLDVFHAHVNALDHFNTLGWHEDRDPNAFFDTSGYLAVNPDVAVSGQNPLDHYHQTGWHEGRDPSAAFDTKLYLIHNPDVAAAGIDPLQHFLQYGMAEGRQAYAAIGAAVNGFDAEYYLLHNPDVAAAHIDPLAHFNAFGWHEGRNPNAWFDTNGYLAHYGDVAAAGINPLQHYEQFGWQEGRDPSAGFDTLGYLAANPDVAAAHINPLDHFINNGIYEGRAPVNDGLWH